MERVALTKGAIDAIAPCGRCQMVWDSLFPGFGLRVETTGAKTFVVRYRADGGGRTATQRYVTVGRFGPLTAEQARKQAKKIVAQVITGEDPAGDLRAKRAEMTVSALIYLYEAEGCFVQRGVRQGEPMKPRTKTYTISRLRNHVVPLLGPRRVSEIGAGEIERLVNDVAAGKTRRDEKTGLRTRVIVRGGDGAARKVVRDISAVFSFATRRSIVQDNPVARAAVRKTDNRRERFLYLEEVARLGTAFDELQAAGANPKAIRIARLWALTGCRRDEIAGLRWSEVDLERGLLVLEASKTGKSIRPLGAAAILLLESLPRGNGEYVFPAQTGEGYYRGTKQLWQKAVARANLPGVTPHTLRHTMGSTAVSSAKRWG